MQRSSRLHAIASVQQHREQQQRAILLDARQQLDKQRQLLQQLESYRSEYLDASAAAPTTHPSVAALRNSSRFVSDLSHAIEQQRERERQVAEQWERENLHWQQLAARGEAMQRLVQQYRKQEQRAAELVEDREAEELWVATHCR